MAKPAASPLAYVPFVSVDDMMKLIARIGIQEMLCGIANYLAEDLTHWEEFDKTPRVASHSTDGVIEVMPTANREEYAFKYVNGHPKNTHSGLQTVTAFGLLANVSTGYPVLISEMTILTALRTAATSGLVGQHLLREGADTMAVIGNGAQSEFQILAFSTLCGIQRFNLFDVDNKATEKTVRNLRAFDIELNVCGSTEEAVRGVDAITTCTADKQHATILTADMLTDGLHINAIGGDCPGKTELDKKILDSATVFVEYEPQTRIEGDIQQMSASFPVTEFWRVVTGSHPGRVAADEITVFDGVGFAIEDFSALRYIRDCLHDTGHYQSLDFIADPDNPRDLFGMVRRSTSFGLKQAAGDSL